MSRRSRIAVAAILAAVALAVVAWWGVDQVREAASGSPSESGARATGAEPGSAEPGAHAAARSAGAPAAMARDGDVTVTGRVIDIGQQQGVAGVEVVFRGAAGENTTTTGRDGGYAIRVAPGAYRAFVRDDTVLSIGRPDLVRLPSLP